MALFSLTDIKIKEQKVRPSLSANRFDSNTYRFPLDIGDVDKGHYVVFNIFVSKFIEQNYKCAPNAKQLSQNQQGRTVGGLIDTVKSFGNFAGDLLGPKITQALTNATDTIGQAITRTAAGKQGVEIGTSVLSQTNNNDTGFLPGARVANKVTQIADTVVLYMPNTLGFAQQQSYGELSRNDALTNMDVGARQIAGGMNNIENIVPFIAGAVKTLGVPGLPGFLSNLANSGTAQAVFARNFGILNPRVELLYTRPEFRSFTFEFMLYPRSEKEALEVQKIINKLNHHSVPTLKAGSMGQFLVPPAEFGISFFYNGMENPNIPKIKNCVLQSINADYAPNGFHAYESASGLGPSLGGTGMPIAIRLSLQFRELEMLTTEDYPDKNYGSKEYTE